MHFGPQPQRLSLIRMNKKETHTQSGARDRELFYFSLSRGVRVVAAGAIYEWATLLRLQMRLRRRQRRERSLGFTSRQLAISTPAPRILLLKLWRRANNNDVHAIYLWQGGNKYASSACN
jgi:hypothetical protein